MGFWRKTAYKGAYHFLHPLLRFYRVFLSPPRDSARILLTYKNEVLLIHNIGARRWSFPGGALHKNETPEACVLRELKEELNIGDAKIEYKLGTYTGTHQGKEVLVHIFVGQAASFYHKKQWEVDRSEWFTFNHLPSNLSPATARRIGDYKNGRRGITNFW